MGTILTSERFRTVAEGAAGGCMAEAAGAVGRFRDAVYLATTCTSLDGSAAPPKIMRLPAGATEWETVYEPPLVEPTARSRAPDLEVAAALGGVERASAPPDGSVPRDSGYASICSFRGRGDSEPALYVGTMSRFGGGLLRSADGVRFEQVGTPGLGNPDVYSIAGLTAHDGRLFALPAGTAADGYLDAHRPSEAKVLVSEDPAAGAWEDASAIGFGDPANVAIVSLCPAHGRLYAGTLNPDRGFQLWQTTAEGRPPFEWTPVVMDGGGAFNQNLTVSAMAAFGDALYVGGGVTGFGYDVVHEIGPVSAELIRVHADGSWDLIAGRMRFSRDGLKVPLSLLGPGLGDFYNCAIPALVEHEGALYLGTRQWEALRALELQAGSIVGGYQLWASANGEDWELVIEDGNGNPAAFGVAALASTPDGLLMGTQNVGGLLSLLAAGRPTAADLRPGFEALLGK